MSFLKSAFLILIGLAPVQTKAQVFVEALAEEPLVSEFVTIPRGSYASLPIRIVAGDRVSVKLVATDGANRPIRTALVDPNNYQKFKASSVYEYFAGSEHLAQNGIFEFSAPLTSVYYLVLDNSAPGAIQQRVNVTIGKLSRDADREANVHAFLSGLYEALTALFDFEDFDVYFGRCGTANAFSTPDIVLCEELVNELSRRQLSGAINFIFMHEAAHSLLRLWGYPLSENEDVADEFATLLLLVADSHDLLLQTAQWWLNEGSEQQALSKLYRDDRHSLSPQRARNIVGWINDEENLEQRWLRMLIPRISTSALELRLADRSKLTPIEEKWIEAVLALKAVEESPEFRTGVLSLGRSARGRE